MWTQAIRATGLGKRGPLNAGPGKNKMTGL